MLIELVLILSHLNSQYQSHVKPGPTNESREIGGAPLARCFTADGGGVLLAVGSLIVRTNTHVETEKSNL